MRLRSAVMALFLLLASASALAHSDHRSEHSHGPGHAHPAHEHGAGRLDVVVDGKAVTLEMTGALAGFLPFEHEPRTDAEKEQVVAMARRLRQADSQFRLTPAAECVPGGVVLSAPHLGQALLDPDAPDGTSSHADDHGLVRGHVSGHGDLTAVFTFTCRQPRKLGILEAVLFSQWPDLHRLDVQLAAPGAQRGATLTRTNPVLSW